MMNMEPAPQHDSYVRGRGRGGGVQRGDPRGGLRGRGGGRAGGNPGGGRSSGCELGKLPTDLRLLMHGQLQVCKKYNTVSGCTNPMDAKSGNCTMGNVTRAHMCGITVRLPQNGAPARLCGSYSHNGTNCPHKK